VGNPQIIDLVDISAAQRIAANRRGVAFLGDVNMAGDQGKPIVGLEWLAGYTPAPLSRTELRVGQVWYLTEHPLNLFEVVSFKGEHIMCVVWVAGLKPGVAGVIGRGGLVHMTEANRCAGAGGGSEMLIRSLVDGARGSRRLVFLSEERHCKGGVTGCTILGSRGRVPDSGRNWSPPPLLEELSRIAGQADQIYTDGSFS